MRIAGLFDGKENIGVRFIVLGLLALLLVSIVRTAWLSDDAYITFVSIDNWFGGYGLTGNITHRVQTYTHPLWMMMIAGAYFFTHEFYYTVLALSLLFTMLAALSAVRFLAVSVYSAVLGLVVLLASRSFVEYSTSGLESPLVYLLLTVWWMLIVKGAKQGNRWLFWLTFLTGLIGLVRLDLLLLVGPFLIYTWWRNRTEFHLSVKAFIGITILGLFPVWVWSLWSLVYYGFPVPNTVYAKLFGTGISKVTLWKQGGYYLVDSLVNDPITLLVIGGVTMYFMWTRGRALFKAVSFGLILYVGYIVYIGGDYMSGRFLSVPLFMSALLLMSIMISKRFMAAVGTLIILASLLSPWPLSVMSDSGFDLGSHVYEDNRGIANERAYIYQRSGLLSKNRSVPRYGWAFGENSDLYSERQVIPNVTGGIIAMNAGPNVVYIDDMGITDVLVARLPVPAVVDWRVGHYKRFLPRGYVESLEENSNRIVDTNLKEYYGAVRVVTTGPLFTGERWKLIWQLNTSQLNDLVDEYMIAAFVLD